MKALPMPFHITFDRNSLTKWTNWGINKWNNFRRYRFVYNWSRRSRRHPANIQAKNTKGRHSGRIRSCRIIKGYTNVTRTDSDPNLHQQCKAFDNTIHVRTKKQNWMLPNCLLLKENSCLNTQSSSRQAVNTDTQKHPYNSQPIIESHSEMFQP